MVDTLEPFQNARPFLLFEIRGLDHKINRVERDDTDRLKSFLKFYQGFILQQSF